MLKQKEIAKYSRCFMTHSVVAVVLLSLSVLSLSWLAHIDGLILPLVVSAVFALVIEMADVFIWRKVAQQGSVDALASFLSAVSGFRMLLALITMAVCYVAVGRDAIVNYLMVFVAFYLWLIIHHSVFFSHISKSHA
jgi:hypothetical protein